MQPRHPRIKTGSFHVINEEPDEDAQVDQSLAKLPPSKVKKKHTTVPSPPADMAKKRIKSIKTS